MRVSPFSAAITDPRFALEKTWAILIVVTHMNGAHPRWPCTMGYFGLANREA
jgi:hypothetical protein